MSDIYKSVLCINKLQALRELVYLSQGACFHDFWCARKYDEMRGEVSTL